MTGKSPHTCPRCPRFFKTAAALAQHAAATHDNPAWVAEHGQKHDPAIRKEVPREPNWDMAPECPQCGEKAVLSTGKFGVRAECCGLWSWGYKPLVSRATHAARIHAHEAFDAIWKSGYLKRAEAYRRLALCMEMSRTECHISLMDLDQAVRVVEIVDCGILLEDERIALMEKKVAQ